MAASRNNVRKRGSAWTYYLYVTDGAGERRQKSKGGFATPQGGRGRQGRSPRHPLDRQLGAA